VNDKLRLDEKVACMLMGREDRPASSVAVDGWLLTEWTKNLARAQQIIDMVALEKGSVGPVAEPKPAPSWQEVLGDGEEGPYSHGEIQVMAEGSPWLGWERANPETAPYGHCTECGRARYVGPGRRDVICNAGCLQARKDGKGSPVQTQEQEEPSLFGTTRGDVEELLGLAEAKVRELVGDTSFTELGVMADRLFRKLGKGGKDKK
jgi:hypothetical protein